MRLPALRPTRVVGLAALFAFAHAGWSAWSMGWTTDERVHLAWSERLLDSRDGERESQPRYDSKTPIVLAHVLCVRTARALGIEDARALRFAARLPSVLALVALVWLAAAVGARLWSPAAGAVAAVLLALDPNLAAHGALVTVDLPYALATLLTLWAVLRWWREPGAAAAVAVGAALGLGLATKFTAMLLLLGVAAAPLLLPASRPRRLVRDAALVAAAAWLVVSAAYLFVGEGEPLRSVPLRAAAPIAALAPELPLPLPAPFVTGLDKSLSRERGRVWSVVVLGERRLNGVWYYFLVCWLLKTPLLLLLASSAGLGRALRQGRARDPGWRFLALNGLLSLGYFSLVFHVQVGYRFVLMCLPLVALLAAPGLVGALSGRRGRVAASALVALSLLECGLFLGNPISFTNLAVQPKRDVFRLLADSNVSWGQNRERIAGWMRERAPDGRLDPPHLLPGLNTFELNALAGVYDWEQHRWLREHAEPGGHFGHSYLWFDIDNRLYDRFMESARRFAAAPAAAALCAAREARFAPGPPRTRLAFESHEPPRPGSERESLLCVRSRDGTELGFRLEAGQARVGYWDGECRGALRLEPGEVLWFRLDPGPHALCLLEVPYRRSWLPWELRGVWIVRGHGAELAPPLPGEAGEAVPAHPDRDDADDLDG